jgi:hypothetical protein
VWCCDRAFLGVTSRFSSPFEIHECRREGTLEVKVAG